MDRKAKEEQGGIGTPVNGYIVNKKARWNNAYIEGVFSNRNIHKK